MCHLRLGRISLLRTSSSFNEPGVVTSIYTFRPALVEEANARAGSVHCSPITSRSPFPVTEPIGVDSSSNSNTPPDGNSRSVVPANTPSTDRNSHEQVQAMEGKTVKSDTGSKPEGP